MAAVACGDRTPSPASPPASPPVLAHSAAAPMTSTAAAAAPPHAAPGCPFVPLPPMASDGRREGVEGEDRIEKAPHGARVLVWVAGGTRVGGHVGALVAVVGYVGLVGPSPSVLGYQVSK